MEESIFEWYSAENRIQAKWKRLTRQGKATLIPGAYLGWSWKLVSCSKKVSLCISCGSLWNRMYRLREHHRKLCNPLCLCESCFHDWISDFRTTDRIAREKQNILSELEKALILEPLSESMKERIYEIVSELTIFSPNTTDKYELDRMMQRDKELMAEFKNIIKELEAQPVS